MIGVAKYQACRITPIRWLVSRKNVFVTARTRPSPSENVDSIDRSRPAASASAVESFDPISRTTM